jgi:hypothetical protein
MEGLLSMQLRFILIAIALSSGCYKLNLDNGQLRCSVPDKKCPSSFHCATDGYCWKNGQDPSSNMPDMAGSLDSTDLGAADMAQGPPAPNKGGVVLSGGVTAQSPHYKIIMSTGQPPGGNVNSSSSSYQLKSGVPALTR